MKKTIIVFGFIFLSFSVINAQNNQISISTESRVVPKESMNPVHSSLLSVVLTFDIVKGTSKVEVREPKDLYENIKTIEDKMKVSSELEALKQLKSALSFEDIIVIASGKLKFQSHEVLNLENKVVHYFVFEL